ncbi:putative transcriptional regulator [Sphingobium sp. B2D3A]|uniref:MucR family transcriptional regulator n=1 Tax=unclassified Sphingobium TaxID=2611147 RepID=UPI002224840C|nr:MULTISPECIES: MucR family transcriptional regulator [unclassified Sphingobium]MCW2338169.1 putative transcriptional regulator [Sphingobium sp. B2D3A]MCW2384628.1 putative transcriptional regulator [Sphingobium sp. B2D3D]
MAEIEQPNVMTLTVSLLSAYFSNNTVPSAELPTLVDGTRKALLGELAGASTPEARSAPPVETPKVELADDLVAPPAPEPAPAPQYIPVVSVEESIASPDHLISLVDGKRYKTLKRHLATHGLTPAEYRERYDLPKDYPMTATSYSEARRAVAKALGLGSRPTAKADPVPAPEVETPVATSAPAPKAKTRIAPKAPKAKAAAKKPAVPKATRKPRTAKTAAAAPEPALEVATAPKRRRVKSSEAAAAAPTEAPAEA